jgi:hypothetical protein
VFSLTANDEKDMALYKKYRLFFPWFPFGYGD